MLTLNELGWLAGIIDGEGCIMVKPRHNTRLVRVIITNTDVGIISEVERLIGLMDIRCAKIKRPLVPNRKQAFTIEVYRQAEATHLLRTVKEYIKSTDKLLKTQQLIDYVENYVRIDGKKSNRRKLQELLDA